MAEQLRPALVPSVLDLLVDMFSAFKAWNEQWSDYSLPSSLEKENPEIRLLCFATLLRMKPEIFTIH